MSDLNYTKVLLIGDSGVGKTAILQRFTEGTFTPGIQSTVGVEYKAFPVKTSRGMLKMNLWDTAGQEKFRSISKGFFRNAHAGVLVFECGLRSSFSSLDRWLNDFHSLSLPNAVVYLVCNKIDLAENRVVTTEEAEAYAKMHSLHYIETSAKDGSGIDTLFLNLAQEIDDRKAAGELTLPSYKRTTVSDINDMSQSNSESKCSC